MLKTKLTPTKTFIFDIGGVCIENPAEDLVQYFSQFFNIDSEVFFPVYSKWFYHWERGELNEGEFWQSILTELSQQLSLPNLCSKFQSTIDLIQDSTVPYLQRRHSIWYQGVQASFQIKWDTLAWIARLRQQGMRCVILSNTEIPTTWAFQAWGWELLFHDCFYSCELGFAKPSPCIYHHVQSKLGVPAEEICFIDDKLENLNYPRQLGWKVIHYQNNFQFYKEFKQVMRSR